MRVLSSSCESAPFAESRDDQSDRVIALLARNDAPIKNGRRTEGGASGDRLASAFGASLVARASGVVVELPHPVTAEAVVMRAPLNPMAKKMRDLIFSNRMAATV